MILLRTFLLTLCVCVLCGCISTLLAHKVVAPPNKSGIQPLFSNWEILKLGPEAYRAQWVVDIKTPPAKIAVASIEPGDYGFVYNLTLDYSSSKGPNITHFDAFWRPASQVPIAAGPSKGTVLLLHGYLQRKEYLAPWAVRLAQAGYRCVLLDLRGHGASTGKHISFGAFESRDVSAVIDDLGRRGWDVSHVGVLGVSYGASIALLAAGRDPRITAVVAFEPFASAERAVPELMRAAFAAEAAGISDLQFAAAHLKEAKIGGFDWADADISAALQRTRAPVLFIHGAADTWVSPDHSRTLMKVAPPGSELKIIPNDNHVSLPLQIEPFQQAVIDWFDAGRRRDR